MKTTIFLSTMDDWAQMNGVHARFLIEPLPARSATAVGLPPEMLIEIEAVAWRDNIPASA